MSDIRHQGTILPRNRALTVRARRRSLPQIYLSEARGALPTIYQQESRQGSKLKWIISTCIAAAVAVVSIGLVLIAFTDGERVGNLRTTIESSVRDALNNPLQIEVSAQLPTGGQKQDRLQISAQGLATKHIIQDSVRQTLGTREFITVRPYSRVVARLPTTLPADRPPIPAFNPYSLYANTGSQGRGGTATGGSVQSRVIEPPETGLPIEDREQLSEAEALAAIHLAAADLAGPASAAASSGTGTDAISTAAADGGGDDLIAGDETPPDTAVIEKAADEDTPPDLEGHEVRVIAVNKGDTITRILKAANAESWQAREIADAARSKLGGDVLKPGEEVRLTVVPAPTGSGAMIPVVFSLFSEGHAHIVTVARNQSGEYAASDSPVANNLDLASVTAEDGAPRATLYETLYESALQQGLPEPMINTILRVHAVDTDFKRRVTPGDGFEVFYDIEGDTGAGDGKPGDLLFTSMTVGGETRKFYRFRTNDGLVDYYDEHGDNARKFLLLKPVRTSEVRFTSGFGFRVHPLLRIRKMHTGIDWSCAPGTPILSAGNGVIEEIGTKGSYGNYIRIRHPNGYQTAYAHQTAFAPGLQVGSKVTQGQIIGYVGTTGLSSGPHLHFEVLINDNFVDPMTISVPRERQLTGKLMADFQKEKARIDDLMQRPPVATKQATQDLAQVAPAGG